MVVAPISNGALIANRWQPMSALTWCSPVSRSASFMPLKIGRSGQPVQRPGEARLYHLGGDPCGEGAGGIVSGRAAAPARARSASGSDVAQELRDAARDGG